MAKFLHQRLAQSKWLEEYHENMYFGTANLGTFVRRTDGTYARTTQNAGVLEAVELLAPAVAFTMSCDPVSVLLDGLTADETSVDFMDGSALLVIPSVTDIKHNEALARTGGGSILCRREHFILVCATSPPELLAQAAALESHLVAMVGISMIKHAYRISADPNRSGAVPSSHPLQQRMRRWTLTMYARAQCRPCHVSSQLCLLANSPICISLK